MSRTIIPQVFLSNCYKYDDTDKKKAPSVESIPQEKRWSPRARIEIIKEDSEMDTSVQLKENESNISMLSPDVTELKMSSKPNIVIYPRSDAGNAELLSDLYKGKLKYDHTRGAFFTSNGQYWSEDLREDIYQMAKHAARVRQELSRAHPQMDSRELERKYGLRSENFTMLSNALKILKSLPNVGVEQDAWNRETMLLQFENGVYDLESKLFRPGNEKDMISQSVGYNYDPDAKCPLFEKAIIEIMNGNNEMVNFLKRAIAYSLTGRTSEQCLFILTGDGCNGKSILLDTLLALMGAYGANTPFATLESFKAKENSNDVARLVDARFVSASESSHSRSFNESRIKEMTGSDKLTARFLFKEYFTFTPRFKIWIAVNTLPEIKGTDNGIWRRIKVIPFDVSFLGREDKNLGMKLNQELPGIMNWAISGLKDLELNGLNDPSPVTAATHAYRTDSDILAQFIDEETYKVPKGIISAKKLYKAYYDYCASTGVAAVSKTKFGRDVGKLGYAKAKSNGQIVYHGISFEDRNSKEEYPI